MSWHPNFGDYPNRKGKGDLLPRAVKKCCARNFTWIRDSGGKVAAETVRTLIVARQYIHGYIVSISSHLVNRALTSDKVLILYIDDVDAVYKIDPRDVLKKYSYINFKDGIQMHNFSIRLGERVAIP